MAKNIVICCDGTGNEVEGDLSNVLKLYRLARRGGDQVAYYDPGVGTIGNRSSWGRFQQDARMVFGLATGAGLDDNILDAYRFLAKHYQEGDKIFLFGFSRGAYTARALAGFVHLIGLLGRDQLNLAGHALRAYKQVDENHTLGNAWSFRNIVASRRVFIHFIGVWDTVASVLVPRPDRMYLPSLQKLPFTRTNPSVRAMRHAIAIDERRRMFRLNKWADPQPYVTDPFSAPPKAQPQDIVQRCFAGVHSDVGGGFPEAESSASKLPLAWIVDEAVGHGLQINQSMYDHLVMGMDLPGGRHRYEAPDPLGPIHLGVRGAWNILEWLPKRAKWREWERWSFLGFYLPRSEPRRLPDTAEIDQSVKRRMAVELSYRPPNVPD